MTLGAISDRIADELVRPDLRASHIPQSVRDAVKEAAINRFWFNEVRSLTFNTVAGQYFYDRESRPEIDNLSKIDAAWAIIHGQRWNLTNVNKASLDCWLEGQMNITGEPAYYSRYAGGVALWMIPRDVWPVFIDGVTGFAPLADENDTNPYLEEGERYIRALAKANILENVVRSFGEADRQWQVAEREKRNLLIETSNRTATNRLEPSL